MWPFAIDEVVRTGAPIPWVLPDTQSIHESGPGDSVLPEVSGAVLLG